MIYLKMAERCRFLSGVYSLLHTSNYCYSFVYWVTQISQGKGDISSRRYIVVIQFSLFLAIWIQCYIGHIGMFLEIYLTNIFTLDLHDYVGMCVCVCLAISGAISPPKLLDQSKNVTVRIFHICPGSVHEHIFLALDYGNKDLRQSKQAIVHIQNCIKWYSCIS